MEYYKSKTFVLFALTLITWSYPSKGLADPSKKDLFMTPKLAAVENRKYIVNNEFVVQVGISPLDAFNKSGLYGVSYIHYFSYTWGWEVLNYQAASNIDTGLKRDLLDNFKVQPDGVLNFPIAMVSTNLVYTPFYSKHLLFNEKTLYGESAFTFGGGVIHFNNDEQAPMFSVGYIQRLFFSKGYSFKTDLRVNYHTAEQKSSNLLFNLNFGVGVHF